MSHYEAPSLTEVGSLHALTLSTIDKSAGSGDVIVIAGTSVPIPEPGGGVISVS